MIQKELQIIEKQVTFTDFTKMLFETNKSKELDAFKSKFGVYKASIEKRLKEAESLVVQASSLQLV